MPGQKLTKQIITNAVSDLIKDTLEHRVVEAYTAFSHEYFDILLIVRDHLGINNELIVAGLKSLEHWTKGTELIDLVEVGYQLGVDTIYKDDLEGKIFSEQLYLKEDPWSRHVRVVLPFKVPSSLPEVIADTLSWCQTCRADDYEPSEQDVVCIGILRDAVNEGRLRYLKELGEGLQAVLNDVEKIKSVIDDKIGNKLARSSIERVVPELARYIAKHVPDNEEPETDLSQLLTCMKKGENCS